MMTSSKPYLIRAIYEWITDNGTTPYITVDARFPNSMIPREYVENDSITFDISPIATKQLLIDNEAITFKARFGGAIQNIYIPIESVTSIYAQENDQGMAFTPEMPSASFPSSSQENTAASSFPNKKEGFQLKVVSGGKSQDSTEE